MEEVGAEATASSVGEDRARLENKSNATEIGTDLEACFDWAPQRSKKIAAAVGRRPIPKSPRARRPATHDRRPDRTARVWGEVSSPYFHSTNLILMG